MHQRPPPQARALPEQKGLRREALGAGLSRSTERHLAPPQKEAPRRPPAPCCEHLGPGRQGRWHSKGLRYFHIQQPQAVSTRGPGGHKASCHRQRLGNAARLLLRALLLSKHAGQQAAGSFRVEGESMRRRLGSEHTKQSQCGQNTRSAPAGSLKPPTNHTRTDGEEQAGVTEFFIKTKAQSRVSEPETTLNQRIIQA